MQESAHEEIQVANAVLGGQENYDEFDIELDPAKMGPKLVQANRQKGELREFQIYGNKHLLIAVSKLDGGRARRYRVNLGYLADEPSHQKLVDWKWLIAALCFGGIAILCAAMAYLGYLAMDYAMIGGTITATLCALAALIFAYRLRDEYTFNSHVGNATLFAMENKRPTQSVFDGFFIQLQQLINQAATEEDIADRLVGELRMCRRLRDEGILDEDTYTNARTLIFRHQAYKA